MLRLLQGASEGAKNRKVQREITWRVHKTAVATTEGGQGICSGRKCTRQAERRPLRMVAGRALLAGVAKAVDRSVLYMPTNPASSMRSCRGVQSA